MLRTLFPKSHGRYEESRSAGELECFSGWLQDIGYSRQSIRRHIRCLRRILAPARRGSGEHRYPERVVQAMVAVTGPSPTATGRAHATERLYRRFLESRGRLIPNRRVRVPHAGELARYRRYLAEVRGFTESTVEQHLTTISDFLGRALGPRRSLRELTSRQAEAYVARRAPEVRRESLQHIVAHLRGVLRYCVMRRLVRRRLQPIDTPRTYRGERPPRALPWSLVQPLLRSIDRAGKAGWRDYAILHLMADYGLRPSEIVALRLDSIDWTAKTVRVEQRKTQSTLVLPLMPRTLALLRRYLAIGRPRSGHPHLFLRARDPAGPLKGGFNRSLQRPHRGGCDDNAEATAVRSSRAAETGLARPTTRRAPGRPAAILGGDCPRPLPADRGRRGAGLVGGRRALVSTSWGDAAFPFGALGAAALGPLPLVRRA